MATEPREISNMTQAQRNAIIAALGCKTIHRMNNGDSLPVDFEPDELIITIPQITGGLTELNVLIPNGYSPYFAFGKDIVGDFKNNGSVLIIFVDNRDLFTLDFGTGVYTSSPPSLPYQSPVSLRLYADDDEIDGIELEIRCLKAYF